jgi:heme a synthase
MTHPIPPLFDSSSPVLRKRLANWLFFVAALVFAIVVVGGITRLTESGLSITEWKPLMGAIPPLNEANLRNTNASPNISRSTVRQE